MPTKRHRPRLNSKLAFFKLQIRRSRIERLGVFAREAIPARKRVIQYTGERISQREAMRRTVRMFLAGKAGRVYLVRLNRRSSLDGSVGGSGAEFINHSCNPNLVWRYVRNHLLFFSRRNIRVGEELTGRYRYPVKLRRVPCRCGARRCRGTLRFVLS